MAKQAEAGATTPPMGALSGEEIRARIVSRRLGVAPVLDWGGSATDPGQFGPASIDLRLGCYFRAPNDSALAVIDPTGRLGKAGRERDVDFDVLVRCSYGKPFVLHPGRFALAYTLEYLAIPDDLMGYVIGRSSWGRLGLIIATATMVNPQFRGVITLELANVGTLPMAMYPAMRIAQLVLHPVNSVGAVPTDAKYSGQLPGAPQRLYKDKEIGWVSPPNVTTMVGVVGPSGGGKSLITQSLIERGYRHFSLAEVIRNEARERGLRSDIATLQDLGDDLRRRRGLNWAAREVAEQIRQAHDPGERIVLSGFKNPSEVEFFQRNPSFVLIAIEADVDACLAFRRQAGHSTAEDATDAFRKSWRRDFDSDAAYGQKVRACIGLAKAGNTIRKTTETTLREFKDQIAGLLTRLEKEEY